MKFITFFPVFLIFNQVLMAESSFTGQDRLGSSLHYMRNRVYDSETGTFTSKDPIGIQGGLNSYRYVENNPVNLIDPMGLDSIGDVLSAWWFENQGGSKIYDASHQVTQDVMRDTGVMEATVTPRIDCTDGDGILWCGLNRCEGKMGGFLL